MAEQFTAREVRRHLKDECADAGGQKKWSAKHGVSAAYVNDVLHARRDPGDSILAPLGLRRVVIYVDAPQADRENPGGSDA